MNSRSQWFFGPYTSENTNGPLRGEAGKPSCSFRIRSAAAWGDSPIIRCEEGSIHPLLFASARSGSSAPTWSQGAEGSRCPIRMLSGCPVSPMTRNAERQNPLSGISCVVIGRATGLNRLNFRSVAMCPASSPGCFNLRALTTTHDFMKGGRARDRGSTSTANFMWSRHVREASMARNLYFLGTAGSGKSTMVYAFQLWMNSQGLDCVTVNLDPGAESLQYSPDLDVRDYVNLSEIMEEQDLAPNGAQVAAADMSARNGREPAAVLIDAFGREESALVYLNDPALVKSASGFVSSVLLSATVQFRHGLPFVNVLSKSDLLSEEELERIVKWSLDPFALYEGLFADGATPKTLLDVEFLKSMESIGVYRRVHPVSSEITFGFDEIYNQVQQVFEGGEDLQKD